MKVKDERLSLRINSEDKKLIQKRAIDKGFKNLSDYVLYACNEEMRGEIMTYNVYICPKCGENFYYSEDYENSEIIRCEECFGSAYLSHQKEIEEII